LALGAIGLKARQCVSLKSDAFSILHSAWVDPRLTESDRRGGYRQGEAGSEKGGFRDRVVKGKIILALIALAVSLEERLERVLDQMTF
jgi:hypothetical protein